MTGQPDPVVRSVLSQYAEMERRVYEAVAPREGMYDELSASTTAETILELARAYAEHPRLGLATTSNLLAEIAARIDADHRRGGGGLDYTVTGGRPRPRGRGRPPTAKRDDPNANPERN